MSVGGVHVGPLSWHYEGEDDHYLGGQGDLVSRLIMGINGVTI